MAKHFGVSQRTIYRWVDALNLAGVPTLVKFCDKLKDILARYPNIKVVDGFRLVPHLPEYFLDNLHQNQLGTEVYGRNLVEKIRELKF